MWCGVERLLAVGWVGSGWTQTSCSRPSGYCITEFLDFGATFDLDRIFSFFFHIEGGCNAPTSPKPNF